MRVDSLIRISSEEWQEFPEAVRSRIKVSLKYKNPKFAMTERLGFSTRGIERTIQTYSVYNEMLSIARGEFQKIANALHELPPSFKLKINDKTVSRSLPDISYENPDFELDERQFRCVEACLDKRQGIIHAATSAGKSAMMMALIASRKEKTLVVVPRKLLLHQLMKDAKKWLKGCSFGTVEGGKASWGDVTFALDRSLLKHIEDARDRFGMVIMDECHVSPASGFQSILDKLPCRYRYGFTGTVKRKDGMQFLMYAAFGGILATVTADELLEAGRVSPIQIEIHDTTVTLPEEAFELNAVNFWKTAEKAVHESPGRLLAVKDLVNTIREKNPKAKIVVAGRYIDPLKCLAYELEPDKLRVGMVIGESETQEEDCAKLERGELDVILASFGCFSTGVNITSLTDLILMSPIFSNELLIHQLRGRLMRKAEGKEYGTIHILWDGNIFPHQKLSRLIAILKK